uniref:Transmembrane protein n=1 Tax=Noctiluca scintillans TaxID=2966 RepID=A0A7S1FD19_NOCSC|mmetsp:Transcript_50920/g.135875  ORF Transcript_50920/g.135875 Transcript_50920/m.135875 type:complete len:155 (+) Transcript_50920:47-511(+)
MEGNSSAVVIGRPVLGQGGCDDSCAKTSVYNQSDDEEAHFSWILYMIGCVTFVCCCPVGLIVWSIVPCLFFRKSKDEQRKNPLQRTAAMVSCGTCIFCTLIAIAVLVFVIVLVATASDDEKCQENLQLVDGCEHCSVAPDGWNHGRRRSSDCYD